jgi:hypothetical protein
MAEYPQGLLDFMRHGAAAADDPGKTGQGIAEGAPNVRVVVTV